MRIAAQKINRGIHLNKALLKDVEQKYIKLYGRRCNELYDMGFLSNPFLFDETEFLSALFEEYPNISVLLTRTVDRKIPKSEEFLDYITKIVDSDVLRSLLIKYKDLIACQQAFKDFAYLYSHAKFLKRSDLLLVKPKLIVTSRVENTSFLNLDSKYVRECFDVEDGFIVKSLDLGHILLKYLAEDLGIIDEYNSHKEANTSLFKEGLTFEDDCNYINLILEGKILTYTDNSNILLKRLETYYEEFNVENNANVSCTPYNEYIFLKAVDEMIEYVKAFRDANQDIIESYVTTSKLYYKVRGSKEEVVDYTVGLVTKDYNTGNDLDIINKLRGYSGLFIRESEVDKDNCVFGCSPITLAVDYEGHVFDTFYPVCCVFNKTTMALEYASSYKFSNYEYKHYSTMRRFVNSQYGTDIKFGNIRNLVDFIVEKEFATTSDKNFISALLFNVLTIDCDMQTIESNITDSSNYRFVLSSDIYASVDKVLPEVRIVLKRLEY